MSRESIIRWIVEREASRQYLLEEVISRDFESVHAEACELFGTWETALIYAGYDGRRSPCKPPETGHELEYSATEDISTKRNESKRASIYRLGDDNSPESVIKMLRKLCRGGYGLSETNNMERDHRLYVASCQHFGSWNNALIAAGINLENILTSGMPSVSVREDLIIELQKRKACGKTLVLSEVSLDNRALTSSVRSVFGSWKRGLVAARILTTSELGRPLQYDRQQVLDRIAERRDQGMSLSRSDSEIDDKSLVYASKLYFPSWRAAVAASLCRSDEQPKADG